MSYTNAPRRWRPNCSAAGWSRVRPFRSCFRLARNSSGRFAGILLAGGIPVPIYPPFRADRIAEYAKRQSNILRNAEARFLVTWRQAEGLARLLKPARSYAARSAERARALQTPQRRRRRKKSLLRSSGVRLKILCITRAAKTLRFCNTRPARRAIRKP